ncbi:response regulator [Bacillus inaquosorum]|uniref:response regulator n=1 Tax=Bacillus inaquosorum TaxID=483913 RepID=UPI0034CD37B2
MNKDKIRVALADDQPLVREGFRYVINAQPDMTVSGEAGDGHGIIALAKQTKPDVILMDVQMPHCSGIEAAKDIMSALPDTKVVILTTFDTEEYVFEGIRAGAVGYLLKDTLPEELIDAIRAAARGEAIFRTATAAKIISETFRSKRELEVLQQMAYGLRNEEIAEKLFVSESTVKTHVHRILQKCNAQDRTQAVVFAIRNGIVQ